METKRTTPSAEKICPRCQQEKSLGGKRLKPGECNVCVVVQGAMEAYGEVLVKHFPEAKYGDQSPLTTFALLNALENAAAEWISNNVPKNKHAKTP